MLFIHPGKKLASRGGSFWGFYSGQKVPKTSSVKKQLRLPDNLGSILGVIRPRVALAGKDGVGPQGRRQGAQGASPGEGMLSGRIAAAVVSGAGLLGGGKVLRRIRREV